MRKYSKSLDLMVRATLLAKAGKVTAAAKALVQATEQDDLDMTLQQVDQAQQEVFDSQGQDQDQSLDQQMSRALARVKKYRSVRASDQQQQFDEADPEGLEDDELDDLDLEQAGAGDIDDPESDEPFVIETAGDDEDEDSDDSDDADEDFPPQQQEQQQEKSSLRARLQRAQRNSKKLR